MPDFRKRSTQAEIMDDLQSSGEIIDITLKELEIINLLLGGNHVTIAGIKKLLRNHDGNRSISIADVGCGSGDILRLVAKKLSGRDPILLTGIDANPNIVKYAAAHTADGRINFEVLDIFSPAFRQRRFDIVTGTLFFHHFSDDQLVNFFQNLKDQVSVGIVINDIHRHWFAYYSIKWLTAIFSRSAMVRHDAPVSVMRAFRKTELENILDKAGIVKYSIRWMWAFRWQVLIDVRM